MRSSVIIALLVCASACSEKPKPRPPDDAMLKLRQAVLTTAPSEFGIDAGADEVFSVVVDMNVGAGVATLLAVQDGNASLYFSTGGGVLGGIGDPKVRAAAIDLVAFANGEAGNLKLSDDTSLAKPEMTRFFLRTSKGLLVGEASSEVLASGGHRLSPLYSKAQDLLTAFRLMSERSKQ